MRATAHPSIIDQISAQGEESTAASPDSGEAGGDRWSRGIAAYAGQFGLPEEDVVEHMTGMLGERMAHEAIVAAGGAWVEDCLSPRDRSLIVVASLVTQGDAERRLRGHLRWALDHGATREELEALITLLGVYAGYVRASTAMEVLRDELDEGGSTR